MVLGVGGGSAAPRSPAVEIVLSVNTAELPGEFKSPWQIAWIPSGTKTGAIAFTDRGGNQVGLLDPATLKTQNIRLNAITSPGPIVVIDNTRFAIAGTGGVGIFDRSGSGRVTELSMANTRNQALALGSNGKLFVADALQNDIRIIRPPYSGPADITKFLPRRCRNPTGLIPGLDDRHPLPADEQHRPHRLHRKLRQLDASAAPEHGRPGSAPVAERVRLLGLQRRPRPLLLAELHGRIQELRPDRPGGAHRRVLLRSEL
jgi:hypothetical protein